MDTGAVPKPAGNVNFKAGPGVPWVHGGFGITHSKTPAEGCHSVDMLAW